MTMTIEEKAKRYGEALERARAINNGETTGALGETVCEFIFPELKESEDEKIKKALIRFHKSTIDVEGIKGEDILAWLEKQGTPSKLSEEEQNRFAKGVLTSCAMSFINYLDAHKHEGKMCVSNGECEDIENAFQNAMWDRLHRYYCKYIEKQGEQKSIWHNEDEEPKRGSLILLIMQSGTPIVAKIIEPKHVFNHGERWAYIDDLLEKQGEQNLIKAKSPQLGEQKPFDYEDANIQQKDFAPKSAMEAAKEEKANNANKVEPKDYSSIDPHFGKPADKVETKEYTFKSLPRLLGMIEPTNKAKAYCQKLIDTLAKEGYTTDVKIVEEVLKGWNGENVPMAVMDEKQGEQKSVFEMKTPEESLGINSDTYNKIVDECVYGKQKSAEWYRENEQNLNACLGYIPDEFLRRWLKDVIHVKYDKSAWSEEDALRLEEAIYMIKARGWIRSDDAVKLVLDWLKCLKDRVQPQPKQEWSEEDRRIWKDIIRVFKGEISFTSEKSNEVYIAWLKSLKERYTWKPSDEQMKALHDLNLTGNISYTGQGQVLIELYNNLKKLTE